MTATPFGRVPSLPATFRILLSLLPVLPFALAAACGDDGGMRSGDDDDDDDDVGPLSVAIAEPEGLVLLADEEQLLIRVTTTGSPDRVALLVDEVEAEDFPGDGTLTWNPASFSEGEHTLTALAIRDEGLPEEERAMSGSFMVDIDREPPTIEGRSPASGSTSFDLRDPIEVTLSEPVLADNVAEGIDVTATPQVCPSPPCDGRVLDLDVTLSEDATSLLANLVEVPGSSELPIDLSVRVGLPLSDPAGNPIDMGMNWTFAVPAWLDFGGQVVLGTVPGGDALDSIVGGPRLEISPGGVPHILWAGEAPGGGGDQTRLFQYDGAWLLRTDDNGLTGITFEDVAVAIDVTGAAFIAVGGTAAPGEPVVNVRQFNGTAFLDRGAPEGLDGTGPDGIVVRDLELFAAPRAGAELALLVTADVPLDGGGTERRITLHQFTGFDWAQLGDAVVTGPVSEGRVVIDSLNRPVVAYREEGAFEGEYLIKLSRWESLTWNPLDAEIPHSGDDFGFAIDAADRFIIAAKAGLDMVPWGFDPGSLPFELPGRDLEGATAKVRLDSSGRVTIATESDIIRWFPQPGSPGTLVQIPFGIPERVDTPSASPEAAVAVGPDGTVLRADIRDTGTIWTLRAQRFNERPTTDDDD